MQRIEPEFEALRSTGVAVNTFNIDAVQPEGRRAIVNDIAFLPDEGKVRLLLHSIAFGSLKPLAPRHVADEAPLADLAGRLGVSREGLRDAIELSIRDGQPSLYSLLGNPECDPQLRLEEEDLLSTVQAMGTSLASWTRDLFDLGLFSPDARVIGLTSEGNEVAWLGYAAVSAAKAVLEAVSRSIALEYAPFGIRSNIVQPGVTDTPALRMIPGSAKMMARAALRNPFGRLTQVDDVARVIALLASDDAGWINGAVIRADGGERISGL